MLLAGAERVFEILDTRPDLTDTVDAVDLTKVDGEVVFDNVTFSYVPDVPVLKDIRRMQDPVNGLPLWAIPGAGKTTIVNLLSRFYDIDAGKIMIDGIDIRGISRHTLRRQLGVVLQQSFLFSESVLENIRYGRLSATSMKRSLSS